MSAAEPSVARGFVLGAGFEMDTSDTHAPISTCMHSGFPSSNNATSKG